MAYVRTTPALNREFVHERIGRAVVQFENVSKFALNVKQMIVNFKQAFVFEGANMNVRI